MLADDKLNAIHTIIYFFYMIENILGRAENTCTRKFVAWERINKQQTLRLPQIESICRR